MNPSRRQDDEDSLLCECCVLESGLFHAYRISRLCPEFMDQKSCAHTVPDLIGYWFDILYITPDIDAVLI